MEIYNEKVRDLLDKEGNKKDALEVKGNSDEGFYGNCHGLLLHLHYFSCESTADATIITSGNACNNYQKGLPRC